MTSRAAIGAIEPVEPPYGSDLDVEKAVTALAQMSHQERVSLLLVNLPDRITAEDWDAIVANHPPPPPARPIAPLNDDEASLLLVHPQASESKAARRRRLDTFTKRNRRTLAKIRMALGVEPEEGDERHADADAAD